MKRRAKRRSRKNPPVWKRHFSNKNEAAKQIAQLATDYDALLKAYGKPFRWGTVASQSARWALGSLLSQCK